MSRLRHAKGKRVSVIARDGENCWLCGRFVAPRKRSLDHVIPKSKGGTNDIGNLRLAHKSCNGRRGNDDPDLADFNKDLNPVTFEERLALQKRDEG